MNLSQRTNMTVQNIDNVLSAQVNLMFDDLINLFGVDDGCHIHEKWIRCGENLLSLYRILDNDNKIALSGYIFPEYDIKFDRSMVLDNLSRVQLQLTSEDVRSLFGMDGDHLAHKWESSNGNLPYFWSRLDCVNKVTIAKFVIESRTSIV